MFCRRHRPSGGAALNTAGRSCVNTYKQHSKEADEPAGNPRAMKVAPLGNMGILDLPGVSPRTPKASRHVSLGQGLKLRVGRENCRGRIGAIPPISRRRPRKSKFDGQVSAATGRPKIAGWPAPCIFRNSRTMRIGAGPSRPLVNLRPRARSARHGGWGGRFPWCSPTHSGHRPVPRPP